MSFRLRRHLFAAALVSMSGTLSMTAFADTAEPAVSSPAAEHGIAKSISAALQGDSRSSVEALRAVPADQFVGEDAEYRACMLDRFGERASPPELVNATGDTVVDTALRLYQQYWWQALTAPGKIEEHDRALRQRLRTLLRKQAGGWKELEAILAQRLRKRGYYAQLGRTPPLRELMVWRAQDSRFYEVVLPEGSHRVLVELLDDFVSRGWSSYARCGRGSSGGWATEDRLYAVMPWFDGDLDSDAFRASLLGHETQHFADLNRFPDLEPWEFEYRAKLTELWKSTDSLPVLLAKFSSSQSEDKNSPHTYANRRVLSILRDRLQHADLRNVPPHALRAAAYEQLIEDSLQRSAEANQPAQLEAQVPGERSR